MYSKLAPLMAADTHWTWRSDRSTPRPVRPPQHGRPDPRQEAQSAPAAWLCDEPVFLSQAAHGASERLQGYVKGLTPDVAEFVFANGPHHVQAFPSATNPNPPPPSPDEPLEKQPRAWWMSREEGYVGWESTIHSLAQLSREQGPFDGILGFSQGGSAAAVVAAAIEHPALLSKLDTIQTEPLKFMISVSGFRPNDAALDPLFATPLQTPSLIICGQYVFALTQKRLDRHAGAHPDPRGCVCACACGSASR